MRTSGNNLIQPLEPFGGLNFAWPWRQGRIPATGIASDIRAICANPSCCLAKGDRKSDRGPGTFGSIYLTGRRYKVASVYSATSKCKEAALGDLQIMAHFSIRGRLVSNRCEEQELASADVVLMDVTGGF